MDPPPLSPHWSTELRILRWHLRRIPRTYLHQYHGRTWAMDRLERQWAKEYPDLMKPSPRPPTQDDQSEAA